MKTWILFALLFPLTAAACIWDAQSLSHEKARSHDLAQTILGEPQVLENTNQLLATIKELESNRKEADPDWWNNLAGSYLRLGQSQKAVDLLEPIAPKFSDNYGIHANLGTAYHLLGRYQDAEKEIARDLQINPEAHFGLEKYHLALLQYLERDAKYQSRHVYVDEFTERFLTTTHGGPAYFTSYEGTLMAPLEIDTNALIKAESNYESLLKTNAQNYEIMQELSLVAALDLPPGYTTKWNLASDTNFEAGVIYMAQMNPEESACFTVLGIAAWKKRDYHLAATAFDRAITLGSPQSGLLKEKINALQEYIRRSQSAPQSMNTALILGIVVLCAGTYGLILFVRFLGKSLFNLKGR